MIMDFSALFEVVPIIINILETKLDVLLENEFFGFSKIPKNLYLTKVFDKI